MYCSITRTCTGMYDTQSNTAQKWHGFGFGIEVDLVVCVCGRNRRDVSLGDRIWLDFSVGIRIYFVLCESKLAWFRVWIEINLVFVWGGYAKLTCFQNMNRNWLDSGSNVTWFCVGDINWLGVSVRTEIDLFFVRGSKLTLFCVRVKKCLFLAWAWKLT